MKKIVALVIAVLAAVGLFGCTDRVKSEDGRVILFAPSGYVGTLEDYMNELAAAGDIKFEAAGGMVVSINGVENGLGSYWMLYTDDAEHSDKSWGTVEYDGKEYASSTLGFAALDVVGGGTYIWEYVKF